MPNIATMLKGEIARVSRKEVRLETGDLKKSTTQYRREMAALKRRVASLEQAIKRLARSTAKVKETQAEDEGDRKHRFSAAGLAKHRQRLGLSAAQAGQLMGVSGQSVYKWEQGSTRPRANQLAAIAFLRGLSKKQAAARLEQTET